MHNYPYKIHNPVEFSGEDLATYQTYQAKPHTEKKGVEWDSNEPNITKIKSRIKEHYIYEQDFTCCYCKQRIVVAHKGAWDAEHVIPKSKHPAFIFEPQNIAISCKDCNSTKGNSEVLINAQTTNRTRFLRKSSSYLIVHPHFDEYDKHIEIRDNFSIYRGRTDKGVNTITTCGLLRFGKDTNYSNVSSISIGDVAEILSKLSNCKNIDEQYITLLEIEDKIKRDLEKVYQLRSQRKNQ